MSYTLIDYTKAFHSLSKTLKLSASARSVYTAIVGEANEQHFPERIGISDRELKELAGVKSVATAHEAKNVLKNHHLIDFNSKRGASGFTEYRLLTEHLSGNRTLTEHSPNINRTFAEHSAAVPINACAIDVLDVKTKNQSMDCAGAKVEELDELLDYWAKLDGGHLSFEHQSKLSALLKAHGSDWLKAAMTDAADANNNPRGLSPKFLFGVIARKQGKPKTVAPNEPTPKKTTPLSDYETLRRSMLED